MKMWGGIALILGAIMLFFSLTMSTAHNGYHNLDKASQKTNMLIFSSVVTLSGVIMMSLGGSRSNTNSSSSNTSRPTSTPKVKLNVTSTKTCPECGQTVSQQAIICKHCGNELPVEDVPVPPESSRELKKVNRLRVVEVNQGPALETGISTFDIIFEFGGQAMESDEVLGQVVRDNKGTILPMKVLRDDELLQFNIEAGRLGISTRVDEIVLPSYLS
jgi:hypothetical protein